MSNFRRLVTVADEKIASRAAKGTIALVEDDQDLRISLAELIEYEGYLCIPFDSVRSFLDHQDESVFPGPRCILSDLAMPGMDGLALQSHLPENSDQPVIFMSGIARGEDVAKAFRQGAIHFLIKPVDSNQLFEVIDEALAKSHQVQMSVQRKTSIRLLVDRLTPRERELVRILPDGLTIKEMAIRLNISERSIKLHKRNVKEKLGIERDEEILRWHIEGFL